MKEFVDWLEEQKDCPNREFGLFDSIKQKISENGKETLVVRECWIMHPQILMDFLDDNLDIKFTKSMYFALSQLSKGHNFGAVNYLLGHNGHRKEDNKYINQITTVFYEFVKQVEYDTDSLEYLFSFSELRKLFKLRNSVHFKKLVKKHSKLEIYVLKENIKNF
jgi:hypothetical protein